jgi:hypothetical protein
MRTGQNKRWTSNHILLRTIALVSILVAAISLTPLRSAAANDVHSMFSRSNAATSPTQRIFTVSTTAQNPCTVPGKRVLRDRAYVISSPSQYVATGGTIVPKMVARLKSEPDIHCVVVSGDFSMTLDCRGAGTETDTQIGINQKDGTRLFAMSWQPAKARLAERLAGRARKAVAHRLRGWSPSSQCWSMRNSM